MYQSKLQSEAADHLFEAILSLESMEECYRFFEDLCTVTELQALSQLSLIHIYPYLIAEEGGVALGYAYAGAFKGRPAYDWAVEVTVYVKMGFSGHGVGTLLYTCLLYTSRCV